MVEFATQGSARNAGHRLIRHRMVPRRVMRSALLREAILLAPSRCTSTKQPFAIRFEQRYRGIWQACAAFAISERQLGELGPEDRSLAAREFAAELPCWAFTSASNLSRCLFVAVSRGSCSNPMPHLSPFFFTAEVWHRQGVPISAGRFFRDGHTPLVIAFSFVETPCRRASGIRHQRLRPRSRRL
jgi:hypothetical protein